MLNLFRSPPPPFSTEATHASTPKRPQVDPTPTPSRLVNTPSTPASNQQDVVAASTLNHVHVHLASSSNSLRISATSTESTVRTKWGAFVRRVTRAIAGFARLGKPGFREHVLPATPFDRLFVHEMQPCPTSSHAQDTPFMGEVGRSPSRALPHCRSSLFRLHPEVSDCSRPAEPKTDRHRLEGDRLLSKVGPHRAKLDRRRPKLADVARSRADPGRAWPEFRQRGAVFGEAWPHFGPGLSGVGQTSGGSIEVCLVSTSSPRLGRLVA